MEYKYFIKRGAAVLCWERFVENRKLWCHVLDPHGVHIIQDSWFGLNFTPRV